MQGQPNQKKDYHQAWIAIQKYCAYQERCHKEVRDKLYSYGLSKSDVDELVVQLIEANFINEERFAIAYAGGKFRVKKWGRKKIIRELERRQISPYCINKAMQEIERDDYESKLREIVRAKATSYSARNQYELCAKVARYCYSKGYESELIWDVIRQELEP